MFKWQGVWRDEETANEIGLRLGYFSFDTRKLNYFQGGNMKELYTLYLQVNCAVHAYERPESRHHQGDFTITTIAYKHWN